MSFITLWKILNYASKFLNLTYYIVWNQERFGNHHRLQRLHWTALQFLKLFLFERMVRSMIEEKAKFLWSFDEPVLALQTQAILGIRISIRDVNNHRAHCCFCEFPKAQHHP